MLKDEIWPSLISLLSGLLKLRVKVAKVSFVCGLDPVRLVDPFWPDCFPPDLLRRPLLTRDDFGETGVATSFIVVVASFGEVLKGMTDLDATLVKGVAGLDATLLKGATGLDGTLLEGVAGLDAALLKGVAGLDATLLKGVATLFGVTEHDLETSFGFTILFKVIISESAWKETVRNSYRHQRTMNLKILKLDKLLKT